MQSLVKMREPVALVLLVALALRLLFGLLTFVVLSGGGADDSWAVLSRWAYGDNSFALASFSLASSALDALTAVVLVALVASCALWRPTPRARTLAVASAAVLLFGVVLTLVSAVLWLTSVRLSLPALVDFVRLVLAVPLPLLGAVALWRLTPERGRQQATVPRELPAAGAFSGAAAQPEAVTSAVTVDDQPTWQPEEAAGAAWLSAGEAATGAAASGWGTSADRGGWVPASGAGRGPGPELEERQPRDR